MADEEITEEEGTDVLGRSQTWKHEAMVNWLNEQLEIDLFDSEQFGPVEVVAVAFANRADWRKSDAYRQLLVDHKAEAAAEREAAKEAREAERAEKAAAKAAEREAAAAAKAEADAAKAAEAEKATKATKATKAPAASKTATKAAKAPAKAATKATPAKRAAKRAPAASKGTEDPFA